MGDRFADELEAMTGRSASGFIPASDGFPLAADVFVPEPSNGDLVIVNSATAVPRGFYGRFATALAEAGFTAITYDYRGIGGSRPETLRGFEATVQDWVFKDMTSVIDAGQARFGPRRTFLVGHSVGGQVAGLLDRPERVGPW